MADIFTRSWAPLICQGSAINTPGELFSTQLELGTKTPTAELSERGSTWDTDNLRICSHRQKRASALVSHQPKEQSEELGFICISTLISVQADWQQEK